MTKRAKRIPDRWLEYSKVGKTIPGTRFIAFKVPLKESICRRIQNRRDRFTPLDLITSVPGLGIVIDLTFTNKYYMGEDILNCGIQYEKILCEGKKVPKMETQQRFFKVVDKFLDENKNNEKLIGVHCTHGVNRTGYLVSRYLIERFQYPAGLAVLVFSKYRGYSIERDEYINDLKSLSSTPEILLSRAVLSNITHTQSKVTQEAPVKPFVLGIKKFNGTRKQPGTQEMENTDDENPNNHSQVVSTVVPDSQQAWYDSSPTTSRERNNQSNSKNFKRYYNIEFRKPHSHPYCPKHRDDSKYYPINHYSMQWQTQSPENENYETYNAEGFVIQGRRFFQHSHQGHPQGHHKSLQNYDSWYGGHKEGT